MPAMPPPMQQQPSPEIPPREAGSQQNSFGALLESTFKGLLDIATVLKGNNAPPEAMQAIQATIESLQGTVEALKAGSGEGPQQPQQKPAEPSMAGQSMDAMQGRGRPMM